jgi:hypothetical protein
MSAALKAVAVLPSQAFALAGLVLFGGTGLTVHHLRTRKTHR